MANKCEFYELLLNDTNWFRFSMASVWNVLLRNIHYVDDHQTDLIYDIESINDAISSREKFYNSKYVKGNVGTWWFGFRESGVDHLEYIFHQLVEPGVHTMNRSNYYYYRKLFKLTITDNEKRMDVKLEEYSAVDFYREYHVNGLTATMKDNQ